MSMVRFVLLLMMLTLSLAPAVGPALAADAPATGWLPDPACNHDKTGGCGAKNWMLAYCNHLGCLWKYSRGCTFCATEHDGNQWECWREEFVYRREFRRH